jgi:hypothetical protein
MQLNNVPITSKWWWNIEGQNEIEGVGVLTDGQLNVGPVSENPNSSIQIFLIVGLVAELDKPLTL